MATDVAEAVAAMIVERQTDRAEEWRRRQDAKVRERAERRAARDAGLRLRHARKLARQWPERN